MKTKTIKKVLKQKIGEWLDSIEDANVREMAKKNTIVTGGAIASMLLQEPVNDYDVYFKDHATTLAVAKYYADRFTPKKAGGIPCKIYVEDTDGRIKLVVKSAGVASEEGADTPYAYFEGRADDEAGGYVGEVMGDAGEI